MVPLTRLSSARNESVEWAITSTIALPMPTTSSGVAAMKSPDPGREGSGNVAAQYMHRDLPRNRRAMLVSQGWTPISQAGFLQCHGLRRAGAAKLGGPPDMGSAPPSRKPPAQNAA